MDLYVSPSENDDSVDTDFVVTEKMMIDNNDTECEE